MSREFSAVSVPCLYLTFSVENDIIKRMTFCCGKRENLKFAFHPRSRRNAYKENIK